MDRLTIAYNAFGKRSSGAQATRTVGTILPIGGRTATHTRHAWSGFRPRALQPNLTVLRRPAGRAPRRSPAPRSFPAHHASGTGVCRRVPLGNLTRSAIRDSKSLLSHRRANLERPPLVGHLGGVNSFHDAVFLDVRGGGPLSRLHERLFDLAAMPTLPSYSYLPHCTIAHYDGTTPHEEALALLAPWRNELIGTLHRRG